MMGDFPSLREAAEIFYTLAMYVYGEGYPPGGAPPSSAATSKREKCNNVLLSQLAIPFAGGPSKSPV